jgi:hypothetical protein
VVHKIKRFFLKDAFNLPEIPDIRSDIIIPFCVREIRRKHFVSARPQFMDKVCTNKTSSAGDKDRL